MINNIIGDRHEFLTVIKDSGKRSKCGSVLWEVKCDCGNIKFLEKNKFLRNKSCGCKKNDLLSKSLRKKLNKGGHEEIFWTYWKGIKRNATTRSLTFDINIEYVWKLFLKQNRRCALTGVSLHFPNRCDSKTGNASLDRIDSTKGYIEGNVQWVHKIVNMMKQEYSTQKYFDWCKKVVEYNKNIK